jgi:hypothetical protein
MKSDEEEDALTDLDVDQTERRITTVLRPGHVDYELATYVPQMKSAIYLPYTRENYKRMVRLIEFNDTFDPRDFIDYK